MAWPASANEMVEAPRPYSKRSAVASMGQSLLVRLAVKAEEEKEIIVKVFSKDYHILQVLMNSVFNH